MNHNYPIGHPWSRNNERAVGSSADSWHSAQPPLSWGTSGGTARDDLSLDSWHSTNRTWRSNLSSFGTLYCEGSLFLDSEESVDPSEDELQELLGESGDHQSGLGALNLGGTPGNTALVQPDLLGGTAGRTDLESLARRGGRSIRGIRDRVGWSPELGSWRTIGDRNRIQSPHRSDSRPLDPLARRHWAQLRLSHRRPVSPVIRPPVLQFQEQICPRTVLFTSHTKIYISAVSSPRFFRWCNGYRVRDHTRVLRVRALVVVQIPQHTVIASLTKSRSARESGFQM